MTGTPSQAVTGFGTIFSMGDGGIGAGVQASKIIGTSNQALKILARLAGAAGNAKTFGIVVSGVSTPYSQVVTASSVLINSATDGSSVATTTVNEALYQLMQNTTFVDNFQGNRSAGNGTGVLVAGASAVLTSGADGAEVFTALSEMGDLSGPELMSLFFERTHMQSPDGFKEYGRSLKDTGPISFPMNFINDATQAAIITAYGNGRLFNWRIDCPTPNATTRFAGTAFVDKLSPDAKKESALALNVTLKVTGSVAVTTL